MSIDQRDDDRTLDHDHGSQARAGLRDRVHVRAVRAPLDPSQAAGHDGGTAAESVRELPIEVLEPGAGLGQAGAEASRGVARRDDHRRVTCRHCGRRTLTRGSGAMWGHRLPDGSDCPGSKTWDHE